jgi:hypothetical protein
VFISYTKTQFEGPTDIDPSETRFECYQYLYQAAIKAARVYGGSKRPIAFWLDYLCQPYTDAVTENEQKLQTDQDVGYPDSFNLTIIG